MTCLQGFLSEPAETPVSFSAEFSENDRNLLQNLNKIRPSVRLLERSHELAGGERVCGAEVRECDAQADHHVLGGQEPLTETFVFRCTASEKAQLRAKAEAAGLPASTLLREALGLTEARRRKPIPRVDPALVLAVGRIGGNLNQIARWLTRLRTCTMGERHVTCIRIEED